jgi:hypothetical protein
MAISSASCCAMIRDSVLRIIVAEPSVIAHLVRHVVVLARCDRYGRRRFWLAAAKHFAQTSVDCGKITTEYDFSCVSQKAFGHAANVPEARMVYNYPCLVHHALARAKTYDVFIEVNDECQQVCTWNIYSLASKALEVRRLVSLLAEFVHPIVTREFHESWRRTDASTADWHDALEWIQRCLSVCTYVCNYVCMHNAHLEGLNAGSLAPEARIMLLHQTARCLWPRMSLNRPPLLHLYFSTERFGAEALLRAAAKVFNFTAWVT